MIKNIEPVDLDKLCLIDKEAFKESLTFERYQEMVNDCQTLGYWQGDILAGYICFYTKNKKVLIRRIAVLPEFQGQNIASTLLAHVEQKTRLKNHSIALRVRESNIPAQKFYEKNGFKQIANDSKFYKDGEMALIFEKKLDI